MWKRPTEQLRRVAGKEKDKGWWGRGWAGVRTLKRRYRYSNGSRKCYARRCQSHKAGAQHSKVEDAEGEEFATHLAITFRLTEAYTGARSGRLTPPTPLPGTQPLSKGTWEQPAAGLDLQRPLVLLEQPDWRSRMTSSGPIHHSRFPAQQGQAALLTVTTASSLAHLTQAAWDRLCGLGRPGEGDQSTPDVRKKRGIGCSHFYLKCGAYAHCVHLLAA